VTFVIALINVFVGWTGTW